MTRRPVEDEVERRETLVHTPFGFVYVERLPDGGLRFDGDARAVTWAVNRVLTTRISQVSQDGIRRRQGGYRGV